MYIIWVLLYPKIEIDYICNYVNPDKNSFFGCSCNPNKKKKIQVQVIYYLDNSEMYFFNQKKIYMPGPKGKRGNDPLPQVRCTSYLCLRLYYVHRSIFSDLKAERTRPTVLESQASLVSSSSPPRLSAPPPPLDLQAEMLEDA